ncbi:hypothetical protein C2S51_030240 [Perilla frutescens var. frutescens]|nr:hypothetical protein C2S51_030240 [Perilla frutescens var. frutescens]
MSSAKPRNFRRRSGDDEDDDAKTSITSSTTKSNGTPSTANKPSTTNKPKKPTSQLSTKSLLSFADDEDEESPFSRPPPKPSSSSSASRFAKSSSAHKLSSSKDRITPHPPSSSLPSNVQPQAGLYTKEALLELQKNTKTLAAPARNKPKPEPEPVVVLKGLIKPVVSNELDSGASGKGQDSDDEEMRFDQMDKDSSVESKLKDIRIGPGFREEKEGIPDQATIEAIRAKRERLRQARAAAPDYIALDGGSNHGAAEGLSDEEPEFQGRIGFFGDKIVGRDKKGVFEDFEERPVPKERGMEVRLDDGVGSQGVSASVSGVSSIRQSSSLQPSFGYPGVVSSGTHHPAQNVDGGGSYSSVGGAGIDMFGVDDISISQQAELAKKAMNENLKRIQESHARTMVSLAKTEENLSSSLLNVTSLENSLSAAGEKFLFMQKLRDFVSVICEFLQHKAPFIEELEEQMQKLHEERARAIVERRAADNDDEISEIELAIIAARAELRKGSSAEKVAAAIAASQAASANSRAAKSAPVELDEFGRDVNLQKRLDITRRSEARKRRRAKADSKRKLAMENDSSIQHMEGEFSTDESDSENSAYESTHNQLLQVADKIFSDAAEEYSQFSVVVERFEKWKKGYASSYRDAYMSLSIPAIFSPYVRMELLKWDPLHEDADFIDMKWHSLLFNYGVPEDDGMNGEDTDTDANLIPELVEKLAIPILHHQLAFCWDILSTRETRYAVSAMNLVIRYVDTSSSALGKLVAVLRDRLTNAVTDLMVPTWSPLEVKVVPDAARVAAYRFGTSVRLLRNICLWNNVLSMPVLEKIALDELLCGKILPHLHSIQTNVHEAILRTERVIASLYDVWTGPSVTGDQSRKVQPLVDYLLLVGKTLERKHVTGGMESETGKLVRRLKKMLVEMNQYDHARLLSRTFNLKEAL